MFDGAALGRQMVGMVRDHMAKALAPITERLDAIERMAPPVSVVGALVDQYGNLILTHSDGTTKDLGQVIRDARDGEPGADGLGFDDMAVIHDGERKFTLRFARGETVKEFDFTLPVVIDRGVFAEGREYAKGDGVTWAGSFWIAQKDTSDKPDGGDSWRLSVKRGRDGKPGTVAAANTAQPVKVP